LEELKKMSRTLPFVAGPKDLFWSWHLTFKSEKMER
jgi:hypothetical protein